MVSLAITIVLFIISSFFDETYASKQHLLPPLGIHMSPCPRFSRISKQPYNPIGHVFTHSTDLDNGTDNCNQTSFIMDKFTDPDTFDPALRFNATIITKEDGMNLNFAITPVTEKATVKHFYFRVIFQEQKNSPIRADLSYFLDGFNSCDVDVKLLLDFEPIVEVFEYRSIHNN